MVTFHIYIITFRQLLPPFLAGTDCAFFGILCKAAPSLSLLYYMRVC